MAVEVCVGHDCFCTHQRSCVPNTVLYLISLIRKTPHKHIGDALIRRFAQKQTKQVPYSEDFLKIRRWDRGEVGNEKARRVVALVRACSRLYSADLIANRPGRKGSRTRTSCPVRRRSRYTGPHRSRCMRVAWRGVALRGKAWIWIRALSAEGGRR